MHGPARRVRCGRVEVLIDEPGRPIPKPALQAVGMSGDLRWAKLVFTKGGLAELAGKNIRLRFHLFDAKVFGIRGKGLDWERTPRRAPPQL